MMKQRDQRPERRNERRARSRLSYIFLSSVVLSFLAGCQSPQQRESSAAQVEQLTQEKNQLLKQLEQATVENKELKGQVQVLSKLPDEVKLASIARLKSVKIGRFTGFYDKNKDGKKEMLIVYIEPMDEDGDKIKAVGAADIHLWDLNKSEKGALLGEWHVTLAELRKAWFDTLLSTNYRCMFDITNKVENLAEPLTVKVEFTDYFTGRILTDQSVIKPAAP